MGHADRQLMHILDACSSARVRHLRSVGDVVRGCPTAVGPLSILVSRPMTLFDGRAH